MKFFIYPIVAFTFSRNFVFSLESKIVGGRSVDIQDFPYQVSVRSEDYHICGGTILNLQFILTAAHCVNKYNIDSVRVGNSIHSKGQEYNVSAIVPSKNYNNVTLDNDVALLKLAKPLEFSKTIQPIELQKSDTKVPKGTIALVSGWGALYEFGNLSTKLRAVEVQIISNKNCSYLYNEPISNSKLCALTPGQDSCQGDSGGPLVAEGKLIGVVSYGEGCARPYYPGVYANVSALNKWITNTIKSLTNNSSRSKITQLFYITILLRVIIF